MAWLFLLVLGALGFISWSGAVPARYETLDSRCEPLNISMCKSLPYNETHFPNLLGHDTQNFASWDIKWFEPLVRVNCSPDLLRYLCSLYAPICVPISGTLRPLPPCRHYCKRVMKGCIKIIKHYGFGSPAFNCSKFPKKKSSGLCVDWSSKAATKAGRKKQKKNRRKGKKGSLRKEKGGKNKKANGKDKVGQNPDKNGRKKNKKNKRRKHKRNGKKRKMRKGCGRKKNRK